MGDCRLNSVLLSSIHKIEQKNVLFRGEFMGKKDGQHNHICEQLKFPHCCSFLFLVYPDGGGDVKVSAHWILDHGAVVCVPRGRNSCIWYEVRHQGRSWTEATHGEFWVGGLRRGPGPAWRSLVLCWAGSSILKQNIPLLLGSVFELFAFCWWNNG